MADKSRRLTALALARAMLAGEGQRAGLAARMSVCLGRGREPPPDWLRALAERCSCLPGEQWLRLTPRALAVLVEGDVGFRAAWTSAERPFARRYLLHVRDRMLVPPLGLEHCRLPLLPNEGVLAQWLGVPVEGLWRLSKPAAWQRRDALGEQHYRSRLMVKRGGASWRLLEVPQPYLMSLQRRLLDGLLDAVPAHEAAYGYTRGRSVVEHAARHAGQAVVLRFDLSDFFASVRAARVFALFTTLGYGEAVARVLTALCTVATPEPLLRRLQEAGGLTWAQAQRLRDPHLPQGAPSSAALANLCAFRLDLRLDGLARQLGACYTRYADDLVFSGPKSLRVAQARIEAWVGRIALEEGFALNHRKTRCMSAGQRQSVCHLVVNDRPNLQRAEFDRLKAILHHCVLHGPSTQNREGRADWPAYLRGRLAWATQLNPSKAQRLRRLFEQIDWQR